MLYWLQRDCVLSRAKASVDRGADHLHNRFEFTFSLNPLLLQLLSIRLSGETRAETRSGSSSVCIQCWKRVSFVIYRNRYFELQEAPQASAPGSHEPQSRDLVDSALTECVLARSGARYQGHIRTIYKPVQARLKAPTTPSDCRAQVAAWTRAVSDQQR